jgi:hypothetical protein
LQGIASDCMVSRGIAVVLITNPVVYRRAQPPLQQHYDRRLELDA